MSTESSNRSCFMSQDENGKYSLTITDGAYPILNKNNLTFESLLDLINKFMYGGAVK